MYTRARARAYIRIVMYYACMFPFRVWWEYMSELLQFRRSSKNGLSRQRKEIPRLMVEKIL